MNAAPQSTIPQETKSICPYCGTGCGVIIQHDGRRILGVRGDPDHPANFGRLCTKGRTLHQTVHAPDRATRPLRRDRQGKERPLHWDAALGLAAKRFAEIMRAHGPRAVAFYVSGQLSTEDYYVVNKLAKGLIGTNHIDTNSRLCMASAVAGYKASLGMDSVPACYEDIAHADCIFIIGANPAYAHPVMFRRIEDAKVQNPDLRIIVADPRKTATTSIADLHLPLKPGTDVALLHGLLHILVWDDLIDRDFIRTHTEGWAALKQRVQEYTPKQVAELCELPEALIREAALCFGRARAALSLWCQGLNQSAHGTDKNTALINLHLATGQIGRPGAGPFSLTGQPNAMGGREVGGMPNLLPGHREITNPEHRAEIARLWGIEAIHPEPGLTAVPLFEAIERGEIKAVWIACTNPVVSLPDQQQVVRALQAAEFVVVQDAYHPTETGEYADLILPAASWGEREAIVTNSERRISHLRQAVPPPGQARPDWQIFRDFALALGKALDAAGGEPAREARGQDLDPAREQARSHAELAQRLFEFPDAESVFQEYRETTRGRDLDISGLSLALLDREGPQQWPFPAGATRGQARLYTDGIFPTPSGRARFLAPDYAPVAEEIDARYPLRLTTGRLRDQWHTLSRSGQVASLFRHVPEPLLDIHPSDAGRLPEGSLARITSRRGSVVVRIRHSTLQQPGTVFLPMHFGSRFAPSGMANVLTLPALDPVSKQPELKHAAVRVEPAVFAWTGALLCRLDEPARLRRLQQLARALPFATLSRLADDEADPALLLRLADDALPDGSLLAALDAAAGLDHPESLDYQDPRRGVFKRVLLEGGRLKGARLIGEDATLDWLQSLMRSGEDVRRFRHLLFAPQVPQNWRGAPGGRAVCNCLGISEDVILRAIAAGANTLEAVGKACGAGTQCGSCRPEISQLLQMRVAS
ncbi:molybdopterin-dependent oxidoreductase [Thermithiobacillus tepidarius DSM 3134]|uniref:nitrate reductase n=1 Tax=Thermithiobacillus tepidarius TaxID=929 RepID=UPI00041D6647|nr:nitrate reductase [Thermithiobacillus tepidarius]